MLVLNGKRTDKDGLSEVDNGETGITTLCRHAFVEQFPRLSLLVVDLNTAQQCITVIPAIIHRNIRCSRNMTATDVVAIK